MDLQITNHMGPRIMPETGWHAPMASHSHYPAAVETQDALSPANDRYLQSMLRTIYERKRLKRLRPTNEMAPLAKTVDQLPW